MQFLDVGASQGIPHVASVLFGASKTRHQPQSLFGCLDAGWRDGSGFWVHPTSADAALHSAAALQTEARAAVAVGYYAPGPQLLGGLPLLIHSLKSKHCSALKLLGHKSSRAQNSIQNDEL